MEANQQNILKIIGSIIAVIVPIFSAWLFIDARHAHQINVLEIQRTLELRDNINYIDTHLLISEFAIEQIEDVINNYENRDILNGPEELSDGDKIRLTTLRERLKEKEDLRAEWQVASKELKLRITEPMIP